MVVQIQQVCCQHKKLRHFAGECHSCFRLLRGNVGFCSGQEPNTILRVQCNNQDSILQGIVCNRCGCSGDGYSGDVVTAVISILICSGIILVLSDLIGQHCTKRIGGIKADLARIDGCLFLMFCGLHRHGEHG